MLKAGGLDHTSSIIGGQKALVQFWDELSAKVMHSFAATVRMFFLGVPRLGVAGTEVWTGVCWESGAAGILSLAFLQTMKGLPPARLLSFCCYTALLLGWEAETWL